MPRTAERETFYAEVLRIALERRGVQLWPATVENYQYFDPKKHIQHGQIGQSKRGGANCSAVIRVMDGSKERWHVTIDTVSKGFIIARRWDFDPKKNQLCEEYRQTIVKAFHEIRSRSLDPEFADYVVQLGLFGKIIYS